MTSKRDKSATSDKGPVRQERPGAVKEWEDGCRCEEVSKKGPVELLKVMLNDLVFWKKVKKTA